MAEHATIVINENADKSSWQNMNETGNKHV